MSLEQLLSDIRTNRRVLTWSRRRGLVLWSPNQYTPAVVRRAIVTYRQDLQRLVEVSDIRVCPAQTLHREYWIYNGDQCYTCQICARLEPIVRQRSIA